MEVCQIAHLLFLCTKIESKANKYTFVWRKTVERNREHLMRKLHVL